MPSRRETMRGSPGQALFDALNSARGDGATGGAHTGAAIGLKLRTHVSEYGSGLIWFLSSRATDLAHDLPRSAAARSVVVSKNHDLHACMQGDLSSVDDPLKRADIWSPLADP